jgi:hypothetical protein
MTGESRKHIVKLVSAIKSVNVKIRDPAVVHKMAMTAPAEMRLAIKVQNAAVEDGRARADKAMYMAIIFKTITYSGNLGFFEELCPHGCLSYLGKSTRNFFILQLILG